MSAEMSVNDFLFEANVYCSLQWLIIVFVLQTISQVFFQADTSGAAVALCEQQHSDGNWKHYWKKTTYSNKEIYFSHLVVQEYSTDQSFYSSCCSVAKVILRSLLNI